MRTLAGCSVWPRAGVFRRRGCWLSCWCSPARFHGALPETAVVAGSPVVNRPRSSVLLPCRSCRSTTCCCSSWRGVRAVPLLLGIREAFLRKAVRPGTLAHRPPGTRHPAHLGRDVLPEPALPDGDHAPPVPSQLSGLAPVTLPIASTSRSRRSCWSWAGEACSGDNRARSSRTKTATRRPTSHQAFRVRFADAADSPATFRPKGFPRASSGPYHAPRMRLICSLVRGSWAPVPARRG